MYFFELRTLSSCKHTVVTSVNTVVVLTKSLCSRQTRQVLTRVKGHFCLIIFEAACILQYICVTAVGRTVKRCRSLVYYMQFLMFSTFEVFKEDSDFYLVLVLATPWLHPVGVLPPNFTRAATILDRKELISYKYWLQQLYLLGNNLLLLN